MYFCFNDCSNFDGWMDGSIDRSFHKRWGFVQPFTEKKKFKGDARNENYGIIYFQASCSRLAATFPTARRYHSTGRDIKTGDQFCVWDVARTWNGSRGKIFNTPPHSILHLNFRFSFDLFEICSFFATCHTPLVKDEINGIIFSSIRVSIYTCSSPSFLPLLNGENVNPQDRF